MIKCDGNRLVGSFDVDGHPRYITGDVQPPDQPFHCGSATLTYGSAAQLDGACNWHGTAGNDDLRMDFGEGVSISGALAAPRSSMHIRGTGAWSKVKPRFPSNQANESQGRLRSLSVIPFSSRDRNAVRDIAKTAREQQLLESKAPIIAYVYSPPPSELQPTDLPLVYLDSPARENQLCATSHVKRVVTDFEVL